MLFRLSELLRLLVADYSEGFSKPATAQGSRKCPFARHHRLELTGLQELLVACILGLATFRKHSVAQHSWNHILVPAGP